jgi:hypothetical protein
MKGQNLISLSLFRHVFKIFFRLILTEILDLSALVVGSIPALQIIDFFSYTQLLSNLALSLGPHLPIQPSYYF